MENSIFFSEIIVDSTALLNLFIAQFFFIYGKFCFFYALLYFFMEIFNFSIDFTLVSLLANFAFFIEILYFFMGR